MNKVCIFDLDGTLIDSLEDLATAGNYLMEQLGYPTHPIDAYKLFVGSGIKNLILRAIPGRSLDEAQLNKAMELYMTYYSQHCSVFTTIYPHITEALDALKIMGYQLAVVTNKPDVIAKKIVEDLFGDRFSYVYGQVEHIPVKPDPTLVERVLKKTEVLKANAYYIGDSDVDIFTAKNAGIASIGCLWGNRTEAELKQAGAKFLAKDAKDIVDIIRGEENDRSESMLVRG